VPPTERYVVLVCLCANRSVLRRCVSRQAVRAYTNQAVPCTKSAGHILTNLGILSRTSYLQARPTECSNDGFVVIEGDFVYEKFGIMLDVNRRHIKGAAAVNGLRKQSEDWHALIRPRTFHVDHHHQLL